MENVGVGISKEQNCVLAAKEAVVQAKLGLRSNKIDIAFVFSTPDLAFPPLLNTISSILNNTPIIGSSSFAVICDEGILTHAVLVMLVSLPEGVYCTTACVRDIRTKTLLETGEELGGILISGFKGVRRDMGILFSDSLIEDSTHLIDGLQERLGKSFPLAGAYASDKLSDSKSYVYFNGDMLDDTVAAVLWGGKISYGLGTQHGWKPLGKPHTVTRSSGNIVYQIDDSTAVKMYEDYFAKNINSLRNEIKNISTFYPLGIYVPGEEEYLLRNLQSIRDDGSLVFQGAVPASSRIRLMIGTKESCLDATRQAIKETKDSLYKGTVDLQKRGKINFILVFDSVSRYMLLGRRAAEELKIIKREFPDIPVVGIYSYGQQAPLSAIGYHGKVYLHNQTISFIAVGM